MPAQPPVNQKKSNKNFVIAGIVILILVLGGFLLLRRDTNTEERNVAPTTENEAASLLETEEVLVRYTDNGFEPSSLQVSTGTVVAFLNVSSGPMWTASAVHPTHQILPEFDAREAIQPDGSYWYIFTRVGTWGFHDHMNPQHVGTIVVE